jgi:preprotein translocase subunit SecE
MSTEPEHEAKTGSEPDLADDGETNLEHQLEVKAEVRAAEGRASAALDRGELAEDGLAQAIEDDLAPEDLGSRRFVYAAYFAAGIAIAFVASKALYAGWARLALWKPEFGEARDEVVMPVAAIIGVLVTLRYWRSERTRNYAEEVASELSKVTWPTRTEVTNSTAVVIVTTAVATLFFALMDRFWSFVTNLVYGT